MSDVREFRESSFSRGRNVLLSLEPLAGHRTACSPCWTPSCSLLHLEEMPNVTMPVSLLQSAAQTFSTNKFQKPQDVLSREDGLHDWEATKLMEPEFPFLPCFALKWDVWWVSFGCSSGGRCSCGYLAAFVPSDTAGSPWFGEPNSSVDPRTAEGCISLKLKSCSCYSV